MSTLPSGAGRDVEEEFVGISGERRGVRLPIIGSVVAVLCWLASIGWVEGRIGWSGVLIGLVGSLLMTAVVLAALRWVDRWTPGPSRVSLAAFAWGAGIATLLSIPIQDGAEALMDTLAGPGTSDTYGPLLSTPLSEEGLKGLFLLGLLIFRLRRIDGVLDGLVLAGTVGAGFAFTETVLYVGGPVTAYLAGPAGDPVAIGTLVASLLLRLVAVPFMHPLFSSLIGVGVAIAVTRRSTAARVVAVLLGYLGSCLLHAVWDTTALVASNPFLLYQIYGFVMVPLFAGLVVLVVVLRRRRGATVSAELPGMVAAGWVAADEAAPMGELSRRRRRRTGMRRLRGRAAGRAVAGYQSAVTRLALLRSRIARGAVHGDVQADHDARVRALLRARDEVRALEPPRPHAFA